MVFPRQLQGRLSNLTMLPVHLFVDGGSYCGKSVFTCSSWSPKARACFQLRERTGMVIGCIHTGDNQGNVVVGVAFDVSPILDEI